LHFLHPEGQATHIPFETVNPSLQSSHTPDLSQMAQFEGQARQTGGVVKVK